MAVERALDAILPQFVEFGMLKTAARAKLRKSAKEFQRRLHCVRVIARDMRIGLAQNTTGFAASRPDGIRTRFDCRAH